MQDGFNDPLWRQVVSGAQMLFVAFGALVLMPLITGLDPNVALFTAGIGTLLFQLVTGPQIDSTITAVQPSLLALGSQLLASTLGDTSILVNLLAGKSGMSTGNIGHLLSAAFPLLLGVLRAYIQTNGMTQPQFAQLLFAQRGHVERALGSDLLGMLGLGTAVAATASVTDAVPAQVSAPARSGSWMKWLWLAAAALVALLLLRVYGPKPADTSTPPVAASAASAAPAAATGQNASAAASAP